MVHGRSKSNRSDLWASLARRSCIRGTSTNFPARTYLATATNRSPDMDVFSRTFLPASAEAGLPLQTVSRHMPIFRRCIGPDDATVLVARCSRPRQARGDYLLLLTYRRLVVTRQTPVLRRLRLHLNTELRHLSDVTWNPDERLPAVELAVTAVDGVRERFLIRANDSKRVWEYDAILRHTFRSPVRPFVWPLAATISRKSAKRTALYPVAF